MGLQCRCVAVHDVADTIAATRQTLVAPCLPAGLVMHGGNVALVVAGAACLACEAAAAAALVRDACAGCHERLPACGGVREQGVRVGASAYCRCPTAAVRAQHPTKTHEALRGGGCSQCDGGEG